MWYARLIPIPLSILMVAIGAPKLHAVSIADVQDMAYCGATGAIRLADGTTLKVRLALSDADKQHGLSGVPRTEFTEDEALLMVNFNYNLRAINMGDTHFDLDVFFLDHQLQVVGLQRGLKAHPGRTEPPTIQHSKWVHARHTLEMRADSRYATQIQQGTRLQWNSKPTVQEIEQCMADVWNQNHGGIKDFSHKPAAN